MTLPVFVADTALFCARGDTPELVADALWHGESCTGERSLGTRKFPFFPLPPNESDWLKRAELVVTQVAQQFTGLPPETPLFIASSSFQIGYFERQGAPFDLPRPSASFARHLADWLGLNGPRYSFSNACISGFSAIDAARQLIGAGLIDEAIVLGVELTNDSTLAGFASMELLSPNRCKPFDARRDGLVLGEAVAAVRLSAQPGRWRLAGLRTGIDAYSMTGPDPAGGPLARVMADCLEEAALQPADIELIKLQAAGSPGTDLAEANALRQVFGIHPPPLLSLKSAIGHTLGASGIAELAALIACLDAERLPATAGFTQIDPEIALSPMLERNSASIDRTLLNLIGFGGGLACMVLERQR